MKGAFESNSKKVVQQGSFPFAESVFYSCYPKQAPHTGPWGPSHLVRTRATKSQGLGSPSWAEQGPPQGPLKE